MTETFPKYITDLALQLYPTDFHSGVSCTTEWPCVACEAQYSGWLDKQRELFKAFKEIGLDKTIDAAGKMLEIVKLINGDEGFQATDIWNQDGTTSKHDRCPHRNWRYEGCSDCLNVAIQAILDPPPAPTETPT